MQNERKKVEFEWEFGEELVTLAVGRYHYSGGLAILIYHYEEDEMELFGDMTINIPGASLAYNEAFIHGDLSKDLLRFIKKQKLGTVQPYTVKSGYGTYSVVAFDMEKLRPFDPEGVEQFLREVE